MITEGAFITFTELASHPDRKTKSWYVNTKRGGDRLGDIKWFGPWRKYCFEATPWSGFEEICLREIAAFLEARTREHKVARNDARVGAVPDPLTSGAARPHSEPETKR